MFAIELDFSDGISPPEIILVRRPHAIVGGSEFAHAVIEGIPETVSDVRIVKGLGREFICQPVNRIGAEEARSAIFEASYSGEGSLQLGDIRLHVTSLDIDLIPSHDESPDRAGVRVLRRSLTTGTSVFPALAVMGNLSIFQSFPQDQPVVIGRSRRCGLRLDAADVSREHSRVGWDGERFWVEDLGSTNGTRVDGERISGRVYLDNRDTIEIGSEFTLMPVAKPEDVVRLNLKTPPPAASNQQQVEFPCLVSFSETIRPASFPLSGAGRISIGRDPANDIWIGAPHVSRTHAEIYPNSGGGLEIVDLSSNGLLVDGERIPRGIGYELPQWMCSIDFTEGNVLTLCFNPADVDAAQTQNARRDRSEIFEPTDDDQKRGTAGALETLFKPSEHQKSKVSAVDEEPDYPEEAEDVEAEPEEVQTAGIFHRMAQRSDNQAVPQQFGAGRGSLLKTRARPESGEVDGEVQDSGAESETNSAPRESRLLGRLIGIVKTFVVWAVIVGSLGVLLIWATGAFF